MFTEEVVNHISYYVYRLIDPRNGQTFYIGKGFGNRVFSHAKGEIDLKEDELSDKLKRVREIRNSGFEVAHVIHRHGLDEKTAFEVKTAALFKLLDQGVDLVPSTSWLLALGLDLTACCLLVDKTLLRLKSFCLLRVNPSWVALSRVPRCCICM